MISTPLTWKKLVNRIDYSKANVTGSYKVNLALNQLAIIQKKVWGVVTPQPRPI